MNDSTTQRACATLGFQPEPVEMFERLTLPHLVDVARFARSLTRDPSRADDLVQDTYLQALRGWHTFRDGSDPKRWLMTICHHTFLRSLHREARYSGPALDDPELDSMRTAQAHWEAERSGVAALAERVDLSEAIDGALGELPVQFRAAVVLVDVEGESYEEAAVVLEVPIGTVRSRLFRGRRLLQSLLLDYARDAGFGSAAASPSEESSPTDARSRRDET